MKSAMNKPSLKNILLRHKGSIRPALLCLAAAIVQGAGLALLVPFVMAIMENDLSLASKWFLAMTMVLISYAMLQYQAQKSCFTGAATVARELFSELSTHIITLPLGWFTEEKSGTTCQLISRGTMRIMEVTAHLLNPMISAFGTPAAVLFFLLYFDWRVGLTALAATPLLWGSFKLTIHLAGKAEHAANQSASEVNTRIIEFAQQQAMLRAYDEKGLGQQLLTNALQKQHHAGYKLLRNSLPGIVLFSVAVQIFFGAAIGQGIYLCSTGVLPTAVTIALMILMTRFIEPLMLAADYGASARIAANTLSRMDELLQVPPLPSPKQPVSAPPPNLLSVSFENVCFSYIPTKPVLRDVSFTAEAGQVTALVGPSGAGKSTLLYLAARFFDVNLGNVRLGEVNVRDISFPELMRRLAFVSQHVFLYDGSIIDNLMVGNESASPENIQRAIRLSSLEEMIARFPNGLDTKVGERGTALSGGERQRISIARAILKQAPILMLDEATSALDPHNQLAIQQTIKALRKTCTILVIAHQLNTIRHADSIIVLNSHGQIEATGTHDILICQSGLYSQFWEQRTKTQGWRL